MAGRDWCEHALHDRTTQSSTRGLGRKSGSIGQGLSLQGGDGREDFGIERIFRRRTGESRGSSYPSPSGWSSSTLATNDHPEVERARLQLHPRRGGQDHQLLPQGPFRLWRLPHSSQRGGPSPAYRRCLAQGAGQSEFRPAGAGLA